MPDFFTLKHLEQHLGPVPAYQQRCAVHHCADCGQSYQLDERVYQFERLIRLLALHNQCPQCGSPHVHAVGQILH